MTSTDKACFHFFVLFVLIASSPRALAQGELTGVVGGLLGGKIDVGLDLSTETRLNNAILYGVRGGWYGGPVAVEGSLVRSPSGVRGELLEGLIGIDTKVMFLEANVLWLPVGGKVSPFLTGGLGMHSLQFEIADLFNTQSIRTFGYNFGGGVKANFDRVSVRVDVRDHITPLSPDDFGSLEIIGDIFDLSLDQTLHNLEIAFGIGFRF